MPGQGVTILPVLEEDDDGLVLDVLMHGVEQASGLGSRTTDVLEARGEQLVEGIGSRAHAARHDDHHATLR